MLQIYTAGRIETLVDRLADQLSRPPTGVGDTSWDPLTPEWIAVPSEGMRRWLHLELARRLGASAGLDDGIIANVVSALPSSLRQAVLAGAQGNAPGADAAGGPWRIEALTWSILAELHAASAMPAASPAAEQLRLLGEVPEGLSLWARARHIAELFDRYHVHRADMIRGWSTGQDVDGTGRPLGEPHRWQPLLWRRIGDRIGAPSPPVQLVEEMDGLLLGTSVLDLPPRLVVFGLSVLPGGVTFMDLAQAVGVSRDVQIYMVEPSPVASRHIEAALDPPPQASRSRSDDTTWTEVNHPLLRSWGRLQRESTVLLADAQRQGLDDVERLGDVGHSTLSRNTMLGRLQSDVRADAVPTADMVPGAADQTIKVHSAHGVARQVEVLRDVLLHLLDDESLALSEDDIIVMSPAIAQIAPVVHAVLGPSDQRANAPGVTPRLRYRITDRSLRRSVPLLDALERTLSLVAGRFDAVSVLDLVASTPVRARFRLSDDDVALIADWASRTKVRWGIDEHHRDQLGLPAEFDTNTWRAAIERLLLGSALGTDAQIGPGQVVALPIDGSDVALAGRLAEFLWRLDQLREDASDPRPVAEWAAILRRAADQLFAVPDDESWQLDWLGRLISSLEDDAAEDPRAASLPLSFLDLRRAVASLVDQVPGRTDFYRGGVTFASMSSMRGVPFRVVVLLGVDQPAFGVSSPDGDDLTAAAPLLGDRDPRGEARQAMLDAVLSARDRLVLIREGRDVRTNQVVPRAVPVAELVDAVLDSVVPDERGAVERRLETEHPRQAFDESAFTPGVLVPGPWSFDAVAHRGAVSRRSRAPIGSTPIVGPIGSVAEDVIELADLHFFLRDTSGHFARRRLGVRFPSKVESPSVVVPLDISGLDRYDVGNRLLDWMLDGGDFVDWLALERRLGTLGPGSLGDSTLEQVRAVAGSIVDQAGGTGVGTERRPVPIDLVARSGERIVGTVEDRLVGDPGPALITYSSERPVHRLRIWLDLIVATLADPSRSWRAVAIAKHTSKPLAVTTELCLRGSGQERLDRAADALDVVLDCYRRGAVEPLPLFPMVSHALWAGESPAAGWERYQGGGDADNDAVRLIYDGHDLRSLLALPCRDGDPHAGSAPGTGRLKCYAEYLWGAFDRSCAQLERAHQP